MMIDESGEGEWVDWLGQDGMEFSPSFFVVGRRRKVKERVDLEQMRLVEMGNEERRQRRVEKDGKRRQRRVKKDGRKKKQQTLSGERYYLIINRVSVNSHPYSSPIHSEIKKTRTCETKGMLHIRDLQPVILFPKYIYMQYNLCVQKLARATSGPHTTSPALVSSRVLCLYQTRYLYKEADRNHQTLAGVKYRRSDQNRSRGIVTKNFLQITSRYA